MFANGVCMNMANVTITTVIKGVFGGSYCCYGNFPCYENDNNVFTNGWAVFWYQQVTKSGYNDLSKSKCWKLSLATLKLSTCSIWRENLLARRLHYSEQFEFIFFLVDLTHNFRVSYYNRQEHLEPFFQRVLSFSRWQTWKQSEN